MWFVCNTCFNGYLSMSFTYNTSRYFTVTDESKVLFITITNTDLFHELASSSRLKLTLLLLASEHQTVTLALRRCDVNLRG